jgi:hypothetical protein
MTDELVINVSIAVLIGFVIGYLTMKVSAFLGGLR